MLPGFLALVVAAMGFTVAVISGWLEIRWLGYVGFAMVVAGVAGGFIFIVWGFVTFPREFKRGIGEFRERQQRTWKRPDWRP